MSSSCGRFPGGPLASGLSKPLLIMTPPPSPLPFPELHLPRPFTMSYPSSHLVLREVGSADGIFISFSQMGPCRLREGQCRPRCRTAGGSWRQELLLPSGQAGASQPPGASPRPGCPLLFLCVLSLNPVPLSCLHSPHVTLALRSPFPPSEIVSISPITFALLPPPRIVGCGPFLLHYALQSVDIVSPPACLADASSGPQDMLGREMGTFRKYI